MTPRQRRRDAEQCAACNHARVDHDLGAGNCLCARNEHDDGCPCPTFTERPRA